MLGLFRKPPPSRLELIKQGVAEKVGHAGDILTDTWSHVPVDKLEDVRHGLADTASNAWDAVAHTAETVAHKASDVKGSAAKAAAERAAAASSLAASAVSRAAAARDAVTHRGADTVAATEDMVAAEAADGRSRIQAITEAISSRIPSRASVPEVPEIVEESLDSVEIVQTDNSKWLWLGIGLLAGIVIGILLAPTAGRRSRALLKDKLHKAGHEAADLGATAASKATDLSNKATGLVHQAKDMASGEEDPADDVTIANRVRTALGENAATKDLERINVDCVDGVVTLRGPMLEEAVQKAVETVVSAVKGVREVKSEFLTADAPEDSATFVG